MASFLTPKAVVTGFKERVESLTVQGDRLYLGTATGSLYIYGIDESLDHDDETVALIESKKNFARRPIEQLGFIKDINSLVVLSDALLTLYPLPGFSPSTPLVNTKSAFSFAIHSSIQHLSPDGNTLRPADGDFAKAKPIPTLVTHLVVGCRRKVVIYSWKDGEAQGVKETSLPHSARAIAFHDHVTACFAYSPTEYAIFSIPTMAATDIEMPTPVIANVPVMGAFSGLTGYMTLGLGAKPKLGVVNIGGTEVLITKDNEGLAIGPDGKLSRSNNVEWPAPPDETTFIKPYIVSVLPAGSVPTATPGDHPAPSSTPGTQPQSQPHPTFIPTSVVQIRSSLSFLATQNIPFPFTAQPSVTPNNATIRVLTPSPSTKPSLFAVTTPTDRTSATAEGSTIWHFCMKPWAQQIDDLVVAGSYVEALALLETIDQAVLPDKEPRTTQIRALKAVSLFRSGKFNDAIDTFIELNTNPAKVVALYPQNVAGRLSVPQHAWIPLYGGPAPHEELPSSGSSAETSRERPTTDLLDVLAIAPTATIRGRLRGLGALIPSGFGKDDDTVSISSKKNTGTHDDLHRSVETLLRYLTDRRPKVAGALAALHITPAQSHQIAFLSETSTEDLLALPNAPLSSLTPEQLLRFAQILDTALFKSYLFMKPGLLGPLCRVPNWCEVSEVEEELRAREKWAELIYLYNGKKMHDKALDLLQQLSEKEDDMEDKLQPSISYLQKLGPEHLDQIFKSSHWMFEQDRDMAFHIFTSEDVELPRPAVANYLESIDPSLCSRYLEYLIQERQEDSPAFHNRLAELYLDMALEARKRGDEKSRQDNYAKLLHFIDTTDHYNVPGLYGLLSSEDLFEARAILLGRLGRHDQALELYAYRLQDYLKAEEYCKRVYQPTGETKNVFLTLLRIYLQPTQKTTTDLLQPALDLISRHGPRLDAAETLQLIPPLVTTQAIRRFLLDTLHTPVFDTCVIRDISRARNDQLARKLVALQSKRVRVTDSRICPQCHKRIGNSVIAVHVPRGEVTHYQCREAFSKQLKDIRR